MGRIIFDCVQTQSQNLSKEYHNLREMESPIITDISDYTPQTDSFENLYSSEVLMRLQNVYISEVVSFGIVPRSIRMAQRFINVWTSSKSPRQTGPPPKFHRMTKSPLCCRNN